MQLTLAYHVPRGTKVDQGEPETTVFFGRAMSSGIPKYPNLSPDKLNLSQIEVVKLIAYAPLREPSRAEVSCYWVIVGHAIDEAVASTQTEIWKQHYQKESLEDREIPKEQFVTNWPVEQGFVPSSPSSLHLRRGGERPEAPRASLEVRG